MGELQLRSAAQTLFIMAEKHYLSPSYVTQSIRTNFSVEELPVVLLRSTGNILH